MNRIPPDIREAVAAAVWRHEIIKRLDQIFQASSEMQTLRDAYADEVKISMQIDSSNKYMRVKIPHTKSLYKHIRAYLAGVAGMDEVREFKYQDEIELCFRLVHKVHHVSSFGKPVEL